MKKGLILTLLFSVMVVGGFAQNLTGKVVNTAGNPIDFANVVILSLPDSAFVEGTITDEEGNFSLAPTANGKLLRISSIGYVSVCHPVSGTAENVGVIRMSEDTQLLGEVKVVGHRPAHKLTSEGVQTGVQGTVLSQLGTAEDVLKYVPGLQKKDENYEVFGKGIPLIYINGRLMRDISELQQLKSDDIKHVELITNPGARYDASVKAVLRIETKPINGEGFSFDVRSSYYQSENTDLIEQLNWNYRRNKWDVFGTLDYALRNGYQRAPTEQTVWADTLWQLNNYISHNAKMRRLQYIFGTNVQLDSKNSIGVRYTGNWLPESSSSGTIHGIITADGKPFDELFTVTSGHVDSNPSHQVNAYYNGQIGKTTIDFNADYMFNKSRNFSVNEEESEEKDDRLVSSVNKVRNSLFATKLVLTHPLAGGNLSVGAEYTTVDRQDDYISPEQYVPTSYSTLKEQNISPFVEYSRSLPFGQFQAGVRFEHAQFDYYDDGKHVEEQSRAYDNFFPKLSFSTQIGKVQGLLSYSMSTQRPAYSQLSNNVTYANRFTMQTGNPKLKPVITHDVSLTAMWKFVTLMLSFKDNRNDIFYWAEQLPENPAITLIAHKNMESVKNGMVNVSLTPKFGIWSPVLSMGVQKQWFTLKTDVGEYEMNKPVFIATFNNSFQFTKSLVGAVEMNYVSKGHTQNVYLTRDVFRMDVSFTKKFFNDRLSVKLAGTDLFKPGDNGPKVYNKQAELIQYNENDTRNFELTVRYNFNSTRSKYKGTGAGSDMKKRL